MPEAAAAAAAAAATTEAEDPGGGCRGAWEKKTEKKIYIWFLYKQFNENRTKKQLNSWNLRFTKQRNSKEKPLHESVRSGLSVDQRWPEEVSGGLMTQTQLPFGVDTPPQKMGKPVQVTSRKYRGHKPLCDPLERKCSCTWCRPQVVVNTLPTHKEEAGETQMCLTDLSFFHSHRSSTRSTLVMRLLLKATNPKTCRTRVVNPRPGVNVTKV